MTRQELARAAEELAEAADRAEQSGCVNRLADISDQLERLATADEGPDHGRLARIQASLHDLRDEVGDGPNSRIEAADEAITDYREELEGV
jgi:hypothetical protein